MFEQVYGFRAEAFVYEDKGVTFVYPYLVRPFHDVQDIVSPWYYGGPCCSHITMAEDVTREAMKFFDGYCKAQGYVCEFTRFNPFSKNYKLCPDATYVKDIVWVDLSEDVTALWEGLNRHCRKDINKAEKSGLMFEECGLDEFYSIYSLDMRRKNAPLFYRFPQEFFTKMKANLGSDSFHTFAVVDNEDYVLASSLVLISQHDDIAHDYLRGSDMDRLKERPNNLLVWEQIKWAKEVELLNQYDLVGGSGRHVVDKQDGVFRFKRTFSDLTLPYRVVRRIYDMDTYMALRRQYGISEYFPQYRGREGEQIG